MLIKFNDIHYICNNNSNYRRNEKKSEADLLVRIHHSHLMPLKFNVEITNSEIKTPISLSLSLSPHVYVCVLLTVPTESTACNDFIISIFSLMLMCSGYCSRSFFPVVIAQFSSVFPMPVTVIIVAIA